MLISYAFIRGEGFNTPLLAAVKKEATQEGDGINPETNSTGERNTQRLAAGYFICWRIPMEKLKRFLKIKTNWVSITTVLLALISLVMSFIFKNLQFSYQVIAIMFALIAIENFVKYFTVMEDIKDKLDNLMLKEDKVLIKTENFTGELASFLTKSQKEIFIIGGALTNFSANTELIKNHVKDKGVKVKILALNIEKNDIANAYYKLIGYELERNPNLDHLSRFKDVNNIQIRTYEVLPTTYFFGIDLDKSNGVIRAAHIFHGIYEEGNYPHIILKRETEGYWYKAYHDQMKYLWDKGKELVLK